MSTIGFHSTGGELYEGTYPAAYADSDTGRTWWRFLEALSYLLDPIAEITRPDDGSGPWVTLASPERCPTDWLPVLAQWAGIRRWNPEAITEPDLRVLIAGGGPGFWRGTRAAMIAAVRRFYPPDMAPDYLLFFHERAALGGGLDPAYSLQIYTYDFVDHDPNLVRAALWAAKPAGLILDYEVQQGQAWFMLNERVQDWAQVNSDYESWDAVHRDEPTGGP